MKGLPVIVHKRAWHFLEYIGKKESKIDDSLIKILKLNDLDKIRKKDLNFPQIIYPSKDIPLEWWYFTGHLDSKDKKYGFENCFFKLNPKSVRIGPMPLYFFRKNPYLIMHSTITDKNKGKFILQQKSGLIKEEEIIYDKLQLKLDGSKLDYDGKKFKIKSDWLDLEFVPLKEIVKHFEKGFEIMYNKPQTRTYYLSFTRLKTTGKIKIDGKWINVNGTSWFDHQKTNLIHHNPLQGWDWFSLILKDNTELMFFKIKDRKGFNNHYLGGSFIDKEGKVTDLKPKDIEITVKDIWKSPATGIVYPSGWRLKYNKLGIDLEIKPCVENQEIDSLKSIGMSYWEGACYVNGKRNGKNISGNAYVELTGYENRLIGKLIRESLY